MSLLIKGFGVTDAGFALPRLEDIVKDLQESYRSRYGDDIDVSPDSFFGQKIGIQAKALTDQWELAKGVYDSAYPNTASGPALDNAVGFTGITRLQPMQSTGFAAFFGNNSEITIPLGTKIQGQNFGNIFQTTSEGKLCQGSQVSFLEVQSWHKNDTITLTLGMPCYFGSECGGEYGIEDKAFTLIVGEYASNEKFAEALYNRFTSDTDHPYYSFSIITGRSGALDTIKISATVPYILGGSSYTVDVQASGTTSIVIGAEIPIQSIAFGPVEADTGSLFQIINFPDGVGPTDVSVYNYAPIFAGRYGESDTELIVRQQQALLRGDGGSAAAIQRRIMNNVPGVTKCTVIVNDTDTAYDRDQGLVPAHSMMAVVTGGENDAIAQEIWNSKAAGITAWAGGRPPRVICSDYQRLDWVCEQEDGDNAFSSKRDTLGLLTAEKQKVLGSDASFSPTDVYWRYPASIAYICQWDPSCNIIGYAFDFLGNINRIGFARPQPVEISVAVHYTTLSTDENEQAPSNAAELIRQKVYDYGSSLKPGEDVIAGRFFGPIYEVPGLDMVEVLLIGESPCSVTTSIPISPLQYAVFALERITVYPASTITVNYFG